VTTPPPIVLYPGGRTKSRPRPVVALPNVSGEDLRPALTAASEGAGIPLVLALACAIAESGLDPRAERWGGSEGTRHAREAIAAGDTSRLREIIDRAWPDISFGYGQRIVRFHYAGDQSPSVPNVLAVRRQVFEDPETDLREMAALLSSTLGRARRGDLSPCGGDEILGALIVYNAGHLPAPDAPWWDEHPVNLANYRRALERARLLLTP
jgi:hypothetical protein